MQLTPRFAIILNDKSTCNVDLRHLRGSVVVVQLGKVLFYSGHVCMHLPHVADTDVRMIKGERNDWLSGLAVREH